MEYAKLEETERVSKQDRELFMAPIEEYKTDQSCTKKLWDILRNTYPSEALEYRVTSSRILGECGPSPHGPGTYPHPTPYQDYRITIKPIHDENVSEYLSLETDYAAEQKLDRFYSITASCVFDEGSLYRSQHVIGVSKHGTQHQVIKHDTISHVFSDHMTVKAYHHFHMPPPQHRGKEFESDTFRFSQPGQSLEILEHILDELEYAESKNKSHHGIGE